MILSSVSLFLLLSIIPNHALEASSQSLFSSTIPSISTSSQSARIHKQELKSILEDGENNIGIDTFEPTLQKNERNLGISNFQKMERKMKVKSKQSVSNEEPEECQYKCPEDTQEDDDPELGRNEAVFSMIGNLWSLGVIPTSLLTETLFSLEKSS